MRIINHIYYFLFYLVKFEDEAKRFVVNENLVAFDSMFDVESGKIEAIDELFQLISITIFAVVDFFDYFSVIKETLIINK